MPELDRVTVGIDFSETSRSAARWAVRHLVPDSGMSLVHAVDLPRPPSFLRQSLPREEQIQATLEAGARERMAAFTADLGSPDATAVVRVGRAYQVLADAAEEFDADLVVVGEHGARRGIWNVLGSTAERLLQATTRPVLLARGMRDTKPQRIVAAVDDSALAPAVLGWATLLGLRLGADVIALHVLARAIRGHLRIVTSERKTEEVEEAFRKAAESWLDRIVAAAARDGKVPQPTVVAGDPPYEILAAAQRYDADLIIMGSRGAGAVEQALIGSVARAVLRSAPCPVLVVTNP